MDKIYYVYILASDKRATLYVGVTSDLKNRIYQHKEGLMEGFTKKYSVKNLVYYEEYGEVSMAIYREKQLKWWKREWKINLIEKENPGWIDLYGDL
ncbi:MAG: hypothetical protein US81_C0017G0007 [Parcubacteria group bacterium GW2011_GWE2_38_18]|nr:MAG: hypothetical protein US81_C0017G0007 [Parcubacteria group bacterium GW2011_GWE2_38_18]